MLGKARKDCTFFLDEGQGPLILAEVSPEHNVKKRRLREKKLEGITQKY